MLYVLDNNTICLLKEDLTLIYPKKEHYLLLLINLHTNRVINSLAYPNNLNSILLPLPRITIPENTFVSILQTFQNLGYIGEMRQRWEKIKKLQVNTEGIIGTNTGFINS